MSHENSIKGGVIIIGSLFWEDENNAIPEKESIILAEKRKVWRETYLDLDKKEICKLPIRYGRSSSGRKCTYTMVFSREALGKDSSGLVLPYRSEIDFVDYLHFERQARILADVEGISRNNDNRLRKKWGCIGIYVNPHTLHFAKIMNHWNSLKLTDTKYKTSPKYYNPEVPLIDSSYCLVSDVQIKTDIDFLFYSYIRVEHRELDSDRRPMRRYPLPQEIAEEINRTGYRTYFDENKKSGITTFQDKDINQFVNP